MKHFAGTIGISIDAWGTQRDICCFSGQDLNLTKILDPVLMGVSIATAFSRFLRKRGGPDGLMDITTRTVQSPESELFSGFQFE